MRRSIREMGKEIKDHREDILSKAPLNLLNDLELAIDIMMSFDPDIYLDMEGNSYCATLDDFIDSGIGNTPIEAIKDLYKRWEKEE